MNSMELHEAQLFRILTGFFGRDQVLFGMSALSVCGGSVPQGFEIAGVDLFAWAQANRCLFTIVDRDDNPKMVIEFFSGFGQTIDPVEVEHQRYMGPLLQASGVRYVTMSEEEFSDILDPDSSLDIFSFLKAKVEHPEALA